MDERKPFDFTLFSDAQLLGGRIVKCFLPGKKLALFDAPEG